MVGAREMAISDHRFPSARDLVRDEGGMALPTVLAIVVASFALVSAAMLSSVFAQRSSVRDEDSKAAIAAADAGASMAVHRQNKLITAQGSSACVAVGSGGALIPAAAQADGWCPVVGPVSVGTATYSYRMKPVAGGEFELVAIGTSQGVSSRVAVTSKATTVGTVLENEGVIGRDSLRLEEESDVQTGAGTNGDVYLDNNSNVCGNIRHGIGKGAYLTDNSTQCAGYDVIEDNVTVPPPPVPADIGTNNSNFRLVKCSSTNNPTGCQLDPYNKSRSATEPWNPATRTISTAENAVLTMGGGDYWICRLQLNNNSQLIMADGALIRVFFDTPENCNLPSGSEQIHVDNGATITATGYNPSIGRFDVPGFYLLGSTTRSTIAYWKNNSTTNQMVLYAPNTDIDIRNNAHIYGAVVGKSVYLKNNVVVTQDAGFVPPQIGGAPLYQPDRYTQCAGSSTVGTFPSPPDSGC
jgi:hypothetical protein